LDNSICEHIVLMRATLHVIEKITYDIGSQLRVWYVCCTSWGCWSYWKCNLFIISYSSVNLDTEVFSFFHFPFPCLMHLCSGLLVLREG